jgi:hypothetical protein
MMPLIRKLFEIYSNSRSKDGYGGIFSGIRPKTVREMS